MKGTSPMEDPVDVTQADRNFAADYGIHFGRFGELYRRAIEDGKWDQTDEVQMVAAHRIATEASAPAGVVPDGWKLVPITPDGSMIHAGRSAKNRGMPIKAIWAAMLENVIGSAPAIEARPSAGVAENGHEIVGIARCGILRGQVIDADMIGGSTPDGTMTAYGKMAFDRLFPAPPCTDSFTPSDAMREALEDLLSWFPEKPSEPEWRIKAGDHGADDAVAAARSALTGEQA